MSHLIALVATAVLVNGVRTIIQPGEKLPDDLPPHDAKELVGSGAAEDVNKSQRAAKKKELEEQAAQDEFNQQRAAQLAEQQSIKPDADVGGKAADAAPAAPAAKAPPAAKTAKAGAK